MANPFVLACPVWRFVHTRFQISNKEFVIISMKDISVQLELKYIQAQNLKIKRSRFCSDHVLFWSHLFDWMFGFLVVANCFCASLLRTRITCHVMPRHALSARARHKNKQMIRQMAIATALLGFNDLGRSVPFFSFQKQNLFTIIYTLSKTEQKINVGC